jgi:hypothetical protein
MQIQDYKTKNFFITFAIGFVSGITPFAFTKVLPMMLRPEEFEPMQTLHLWIMVSGMLITGVIVGAIIALIYGGSKDPHTPKEVFLYALGVPAILITTVTNFSTEVKAKSEIAAMQDTANALISNVNSNPQQIPESTFKSVTSSNSGTVSGGLLVRTAFAGDGDRPVILAQQRQQKPYLVIIGTYTSRQEAESALAQFVNRKFRTETYVPKHLELLKQAGGTPQYAIIYARFKTAAEATQAKRYLMVNDRDLQVSLSKQSQ